MGLAAPNLAENWRWLNATRSARRSRDDETTGPLNNVITIDDERIKSTSTGSCEGAWRRTLNGLLEAEADQLCKAQRYERSKARRDTRAGHQERKLPTKAGEVRLKVPKLRAQTVETAIIERYRRLGRGGTDRDVIWQGDVRAGHDDWWLADMALPPAPPRGAPFSPQTEARTRLSCKSVTCSRRIQPISQPLPNSSRATTEGWRRGGIKEKRAGGTPARLCGRQLPVYQAATCFRRRRAKARRPPQAITRPGSPAPMIGPGTAAIVYCCEKASVAPIFAVKLNELRIFSGMPPRTGPVRSNTVWLNPATALARRTVAPCRTENVIDSGVRRPPLTSTMLAAILTCDAPLTTSTLIAQLKAPPVVSWPALVTPCTANVGFMGLKGAEIPPGDYMFRPRLGRRRSGQQQQLLRLKGHNDTISCACLPLYGS